MKKYYAVYVFLMLTVFCMGSVWGKAKISLSEFLTVFLFVAVLIAVGLQDIKFMKISDKWNIVILGIAVLSCVSMPEPALVSRIMGLVCASVPLLLLALLVPGSFGGGDIKLMAVGGLFLGWKAMLVSAVTGILLAGAWTGCMLAMGKIGKNDSFSLGPFLCLGMVIGIYAGNSLAEIFFKI